MINGTKVLRDDNPRRPSIDQPETPATSSHPIPRRLAAILRAIGARLFAANDAEATWQGWQIIERHSGLSRRYRDPRFDWDTQ
jgi:hypothetical protein